MDQSDDNLISFSGGCNNSARKSAEIPEHNFEHVSEAARRVVARLPIPDPTPVSGAEFFAAYRDCRARNRPKACTGGPNCWVEKGPPAWDKKANGSCAECHDGPDGRRGFRA